MEENYILFETAKLAKEKGFNLPCNYYYETSRQLIYFGGSKHSYTSIDKTLWSNMYLLAPTQSLLQKWLREAHNIDVYSTWGTNDGKVVWYFYISNIGIHSPIVYKEKFICYEEAYEKGLQEALKLIQSSVVN